MIYYVFAVNLWLGIVNIVGQQDPAYKQLAFRPFLCSF